MGMERGGEGKGRVGETTCLTPPHWLLSQIPPCQHRLLPKHRRRSRGGGADWAVAVANGIKCPPPFRRLSVMMPASTEKTQAYIGENV